MSLLPGMLLGSLLMINALTSLKDEPFRKSPLIAFVEGPAKSFSSPLTDTAFCLDSHH